jgi:hypothetical protein
MIAKPVTYKKIENGIYTAFKDDKDIFNFYDPNVQVSNINDIVNDIRGKALTYGNDVEYREVYCKNELAGYFFFYKKLLISFALNNKFRTRGNLRDFFRLIKTEIGNGFQCFLWSKNTRAVKWLLKNKMTGEEMKSPDPNIKSNIIHLICL